MYIADKLRSVQLQAAMLMPCALIGWWLLAVLTVAHAGLLYMQVHTRSRTVRTARAALL